MAINRYKSLTFDGKQLAMPKITILNRKTDRFVTYNPDNNRLDRISGAIYGDDGYGSIILMANPEYYMEQDIPKNTVIRVPYPLREVEAEFDKKINFNKDK